MKKTKRSNPREFLRIEWHKLPGSKGLLNTRKMDKSKPTPRQIIVEFQSCWNSWVLLYFNCLYQTLEMQDMCATFHNDVIKRKRILLQDYDAILESHETYFQYESQIQAKMSWLLIRKVWWANILPWSWSSPKNFCNGPYVPVSRQTGIGYEIRVYNYYRKVKLFYSMACPVSVWKDKAELSH